MGKKGKAKRNGVSKSNPHKLLPQVRAEVTEIVDQLFKKCTKVPTPSTNAVQEWEKYIQIYQLVEKIRDKEKSVTLPHYNRVEQIEPYLQWLNSNNVKINGVEMFDYKEDGYGLKTTKNLNEGDVVLTIPKICIMSEETARKSYLGTLIEKDPILQHMGNVALSLHLLGEYVNPNSFWVPYLRALPSAFSTTLLFAPDEMKLLKGSPIQDEAIKQFQNIARQYSYFYRIFLSLPEARSWPIRDYFTFDAYRWAVSAIMTRLNRIPSKESSGQLALIPAWDMANHEHGSFSTDFDEEKEQITCFAQRNFKAGDQFKIYYGQRSNSEFLLHSGFVYKDNPNDSLALKLGVSKSDPLYEEKAKLLSAVSLSLNGTLYLVPGKHPISPDLLCFTRIFCMDKESLEFWSSDKSKAKDLRHEDCDVGTVVQDKTLKFLLTRVTLLQRSYPTKLEEDESSLETATGNERLIRSMLVEEKKILRDAVTYLSSRETNCCSESEAALGPRHLWKIHLEDYPSLELTARVP